MRASKFQRYALCPGSYPREHAGEIAGQESNQENAPEETTPEAESGTTIHAALAGQEHRRLTVPEEQVFERCQDAIGAYLEELGEPGHQLVEKRMVIPAKHLGLMGLEITGHPDLVVVYPEKKLAVIFDYKTGWGDVPKAYVNLQLRIYAIAVRMKFGADVERVDVVILQPRVNRQPDVTVYDVPALRQAFQEVKEIAKRALAADPDKDLHPSEEACKYCPCLTCPARLGVVNRVAQLAVAPDVWETYTVQERLSLWGQAKLAKKVIALIEARFKQDLQKDPDAYQGALRLHESPGRREILDPGACFTVFNAEGMEGEDFSRACKVTIGALETVYRDTQRWLAWHEANPEGTREQFNALSDTELRRIQCLKGDLLKKRFNQLLEPICDRKPTEPSVEADPEKLTLLLQS